MTKMKRIPTIKCDRCGGTGTIPAPTTGTLLRDEREGHGLTREQVAAHFYKDGSKSTYSPSYIADLERCKRDWSLAMVINYRAAMLAAKNGDGK